MKEECEDCGAAILPWNGGSCPSQCWRKDKSMEEETYIVISVGEGVRIEELDKSILLDRLNENYYGNTEDIVKHALPDEKDVMYWGKSLTIVKGKVTVPKSVETVTLFELD